jgi:hypothetical protein
VQNPKIVSFAIVTAVTAVTAVTKIINGRGEFITDAKVEIISLSIRRLQSNFKKKVEHAYTYKEKAYWEKS